MSSGFRSFLGLVLLAVNGFFGDHHLDEQGDYLRYLIFLNGPTAETERKENKSTKHLLEHLLDPSYYNKWVRPVTHSQDPINVTFGLVLKVIEDLVRINQHN